MVLNKEYIPAYLLKPQERALINTIQVEEGLKIQLSELGVYEGVEIMLKSKAPFQGPAIFKINNVDLGLDKHIALNILVEKSI